MVVHRAMLDSIRGATFWAGVENMSDTERALTFWLKIEKKFPLIITAMKADFSNPNNAHVRKFFVKSSRTIITSLEPALEYSTDVYDELKVAMLTLENVGLIQDITGDGVIYRFNEHFVDYLKQ